MTGKYPEELVVVSHIQINLLYILAQAQLALDIRPPRLAWSMRLEAGPRLADTFWISLKNWDSKSGYATSRPSHHSFHIILFKLLYSTIFVTYQEIRSEFLKPV